MVTHPCGKLSSSRPWRLLSRRRQPKLHRNLGVAELSQGQFQNAFWKRFKFHGILLGILFGEAAGMPSIWQLPLRAFFVLSLPAVGILNLRRLDFAA
jgi:hypothetical protein